MESDPIGLASGTNSYAYARHSPATFTDPEGLFAPAPPVMVFGISPAGVAVCVVACPVGAYLLYEGNAARVQDALESVFRSPSSSSGGTGCPPDDACKKMLEAIQQLRKTMDGLPLEIDPSTRQARPGPHNARILQLRRQLNDLIDLYNKLCARSTGPLSDIFKLEVGPRRPSLPGRLLLEDFYLR